MKLPSLFQPTFAGIALPVFALMLAPMAASAQEGSHPLMWIAEEDMSGPTGVSWGVPWPRGEVQSDHHFSLRTPEGESLPVQSWPMAYWPDGSIKWTGFATVASPGTDAVLHIDQDAEPAGDAVVRVREGETTFEIDTGPLQVLITKWGGSLIRSMSIDGRVIARQGELIALVQDGPDDHLITPERRKFFSRVENVTIEQSGPVRAVVKIEGIHQAEGGSRTLFPFTVRFYFYAGQESVRMVHSFIYDGDDAADMVRGLGIRFAVPMREQIQNRHVRFSGEGDGLWSEPIQPMTGRGGRYAAHPETGDDVYPDQVAGRRVPNREELNASSRNFLADWASWSDFRLIQPNADGFSIEKRTGPRSAWIPAGAGRRASGLVFVGDVSGGLGISLKDFWQSYPSALEVRNATSGEADLFVWLWSPEAPAMDMRHYDTKPHGLQAAYEDVQPGFADPYGVARTSELTLYPSAEVPAKEASTEMARAGSFPPRLMATPEHLHGAGVFGFWSLPDRSTPFKEAIEDRLESYIDFYQAAIEQNRWYGFWDYGDVMHSSDRVRNVWNYDLGGLAWANTELMPDMWLWYSYMRTGRADIFRMAEAMTRHTQEVDVYHLGRFAGLGTRHNVRHWGDGAKEVRISQAALKRYYHFLTTDERTGDLISEVARIAPHAVAALDPMRLAQPATEEEQQYPARLRIGPDWFALVGNWFAEWERTGDTKWRDKIYNGIDSLVEMPLGLRSGRNLVVGMDTDTFRLYQLSDQAGEYNLATIMGGGQVGIELSRTIDHEGWHDLWLRYCRLYYAPREVLLRDLETGAEGEDASHTRPDRLAAYAYMRTGNEAYARQALRRITFRGDAALDTVRIEGPHVLNPVDFNPRVNTNNAAQWSLSAIEILELISDRLPDEVPDP